MTAKRILQSTVVVAILTMSLVPATASLAWSGCTGYVTAQWGDTMSSLAAACGTSVNAIMAANPGIGSQLYAGQVLYMPAGHSSAPVNYPVQMSGNIYVVQPADTLGGIAMMDGVSLGSLLAVNPQISNASLIYPGQVIYLPVPLNFPSYTTNPSSTAYLTLSYPTSTTTSTVSSGFGNLKVTYGHGLLVRTGPGTSFSEIQSPFVSAVKNSTWRYRKNSLTTDSIGFVWVEVALSQAVNGSSTGWILTRDSLGKYFTDPNLGPAIDPNDP